MQGGIIMRRSRRKKNDFVRFSVAFAVGLLACWVFLARFLAVILVVSLLVCCLCN